MTEYYRNQIPWSANYDEKKIPPYTLPDLMTCSDGTPVNSKEVWMEKRRPELLRLFREYMYGEDVPMPDRVSYEIMEAGTSVFGGLGTRRQIRMTFSMNDGRSRSAMLLLYLPANASPAPVFVGLTFKGNQVVEADPAVIPSGDHEPVNKDNAPGVHAHRFPLDLILKRGYAYAICSCNDFFFDTPSGWTNSIYTLFYSEEELLARPADRSAIGAWSWGLSRMLDYLETIPEVDAGRAAVVGHSRLGKTALWTGARDSRFQVVCCNDSGCGGAALSRRLFGETLFSMVRCSTLYFWFCKKLEDFCENPETLPVDQHELHALIAPRQLTVHSATEDLWADPTGEYLAEFEAGPAFALFGETPLASSVPPPPDTPAGTNPAYYCRTGEHNILAADFQHYMDCADRFFGR